MIELKKYTENKSIIKLIAVVLLIIMAFSIRPLLNVILLTFIFCFLFYNLENFINKRVSRFFVPNERITTVVVYLAVGGILATVISSYVPIIKSQIISISEQISNFDLGLLAPYINNARIEEIIMSSTTKDFMKEGGDAIFNAVTSIGKFAINIVVAFILSFFLLFDKKGMREFGERVKKSKVGFLYDEFSYFGRNFVNTFGRVIQLQLIIAFINALLSYIVLSFLGFPTILGLVIMIFFLGLIPVAGVVISFIPLSIIAFQIGGAVKVVSVVAMILLLHALESYVLNPKLMSVRIKMPVFIVFAVLVVAEYAIGIWGLLIGIPLFVFVTDILGVKPDETSMKE